MSSPRMFTGCVAIIFLPVVNCHLPGLAHIQHQVVYLRTFHKFTHQGHQRTSASGPTQSWTRNLHCVVAKGPDVGIPLLGCRS